MKRIKCIILAIRNTAYFALLTVVLLGMLSCGNEEEEQLTDLELVIPSNAYSFTVSTVNTEKESIVFAEPSFTKNLDILGCVVKKIVYYVDNSLASTETSAPFKLEYRTNHLSKGQHILKAVFTVGGDGYKDKTVECVKEFNVTNSSSSSQSNVKFDIQYDTYLRVGDKIHVSVNIIDIYNAGYKIREVQYYFEDKLISNIKNAPFDLDYTPTLVVGQKYKLQIDISYSIGTTTVKYSYVTSVIVLADDETRYLFYPSFTYDPHFSNGETISGKGLLYRGKGDENSYELNIYWDEELVGTSRIFPYEFNYTIINAKMGIHKLKHEWKTYNKNGKYQGGSSSENKITIDK